MKTIVNTRRNHMLTRSTDADLDEVLKTVDKKIARSLLEAEQAHKQRLAKIQAPHGG